GVKVSDLAHLTSFARSRASASSRCGSFCVFLTNTRTPQSRSTAVLSVSTVHIGQSWQKCYMAVQSHQLPGSKPAFAPLMLQRNEAAVAHVRSLEAFGDDAVEELFPHRFHRLRAAGDHRLYRLVVHRLGRLLGEALH